MTDAPSRPVIGKTGNHRSGLFAVAVLGLPSRHRRYVVHRGYEGAPTLARSTAMTETAMRQMKEGDKLFTLYWLTGRREVVSGRDIAEAMTLAGYSAGALRALDFYASGDNQEYNWVEGERKWMSRAHAEQRPSEKEG